MDSGFYAACTGMISRTQALDVVANNLANASTIAYKGEKNLFRSLLATATGALQNPVNQAINNFGVLGGTRLDLSQGTLDHTGNDMDVGIEGSGFFVVQTDKGRFYTRAGNFRLSSKAQLTTSCGDLVLGDSGPISIPNGAISISPDGTISAGGAVAGKIKLVDFAPGTELEGVGRNYYSAKGAKEIEPKNSRIMQGNLEGSNVNPMATAMDLIAVQRYAEMMQRALTMFDSDVNKVATQDLPRVNG